MSKQTFLEGIANDVVNILKRRVAVDTGQLRASIKYEILPNQANIKMLDYGKFVEYGSPPRVIRPVNKKALKFTVKGKDVFATKVNHPGTRPQPFIRPTFRDDLPKIIFENAKRHLK